MFNESEKYDKLNQLALEHGARERLGPAKLLVSDGTEMSKMRTVPGLQMWDHDP